MDDDPLAAILGEKQEELDENDYLPDKNKGSRRDGGNDPEILAPDLLAACKANDEGRAQDLLADGVSPGYSDPESVVTRALVRAGAASGYKRASTTLTQASKQKYLEGRKAHKQNNAGRAPTSSIPMTGSPLHWSAYRGDLGITWILLKEGYSPNDTDDMGNTVTHLAAANGHERVLDTLIRDGADVHRQNKFKNTPHDVANSAECRGILRRAEASPAPSTEEEEKMHDENLQRTLEVERVLIEVVGPLEPTDDENRRRKRQLQQQERDGGHDEGGEDGVCDAEEDEEGKLGGEKKDEAGAESGTAETDGQASGGRGAGEKGEESGGGGRGGGGEDNPPKGDAAEDQDGNALVAEEKGGDDRAGGGSKSDEGGGHDGAAGEKKDEAGAESGTAETDGQASGGRGAGEKGQQSGGGGGAGGGGEDNPPKGDAAEDQDGNALVAEEKGGDDRAGGGSKSDEGGGHDGAAGEEEAIAEGKETEGGGGGQDKDAEGKDAGGIDGGVEGGGGAADGNTEPGEDLLAQVEQIREAVAGAEALCICEDLVASARLGIDGLLLQHSIEKQVARVAGEGPIVTQQAYTTLVNRLTLLLRRAEGNSRITGKLKRRAKALVEKSHGEYWLQVSAQRLLKVDCAEARHVPDMAKLEACIDKAAKVGAQAQLVRDCRSLLKRLTTEVEISKAITGFPTVRLPIDQTKQPMPKDYWQPEDIGQIEETEDFPLPPVDADGKNLDYVWVPSKSLRALSAACKRMSEALVGGEGLNPELVERGSKKLHEYQKELKLLTEKDTADKDKAVSVAAKAAKKKKKKGGGGKKKKK